LIDVAGESRVRIAIVEDVATGKIIARIILLARKIITRNRAGCGVAVVFRRRGRWSIWMWTGLYATSGRA
jgi:hypothetical protein